MDATANLGAHLVANLAQSVLGKMREVYFPEDGPFRRSFYPKHLDFFEATTDYKVLSLFGGNRTGKSFAPCYAIACWVSGDYPEWWNGRRFTKPLRVWAVGETGTLVRNNLQRYLIGDKGRTGIGSLFTSDEIAHVSWQSKPEGLAERAIIRGKFGDSIIEFKSYDMERRRFASDVADVILLDEEAPAGIFSECLTRTGTTRGLVINAFTALKGVTPLVSMLLPQYADPDADEVDMSAVSRWHEFIGWDDIPEAQLPMDERRKMAANYLPGEKLARMKGIPTLGSGLIWPVAEEDIIVPAFRVPSSWPQLITLDPGWNHGTGAMRWALDQDAGAIYGIADYWKRLETVAVHADALNNWGEWQNIAMDYASGMNVDDGEDVKSKYRSKLRATVINARKRNSTDAGHQDVYERMVNGQLFIFDTCQKWIYQFRQYVRNEKGKIAIPTKDVPDEKRHHFELMDCTRYACNGLDQFKVMPPEAMRNRARVAPHEARTGHTEVLDQGFF